MTAHGYDPNYGRRLPRAMAAAGLVDVGTHAAAAVVTADPERGVPQWELLVAQLTPALLASGLVTAADLDAFTALCHDGGAVMFAPLMVSCWDGGLVTGRSAGRVLGLHQGDRGDPVDGEGPVLPAPLVVARRKPPASDTGCTTRWLPDALRVDVARARPARPRARRGRAPPACSPW